MESENGRTYEPIPLKRKDLWKQLANTVVLISKQDQISWTIFSVFWAANALLLVALFNGGKWPDDFVGAFISLFGSLLSAVWREMLIRGIGHCDRVEKLADKIERELHIKPEFAMSAKLNPDYYVCLGNRIGYGHYLMKACSNYATAIWILLFAWFGIRLLLAAACHL